MPIASALTLETAISIPPNSAATSATQAISPGPSATSTARPVARTPLAFSAATVCATSSAWRAQIATSAPSAASVSAMAWPIPLVPPVTTARRPFSPRSIGSLLVRLFSLLCFCYLKYFFATEAPTVYFGSTMLPSRTLAHWVISI